MGVDESHADQTEQKTVLIADDDETVLQTFESWFAAYDGWEVQAVTDGGEAVKAFDEDIDVLLLDRMMDELCGHQVLSRYESAGYEFPVIVVSGYNPNSYLHEEDVDLYLRKPLDRNEFLNTVEEIVEE